MSNEVLDFIHKRFPIDNDWVSGNCYYFARILNARFGGLIYYDVEIGHFVTEINGRFYDWNGEVPENDDLYVLWSNFDSYDPCQKMRIVRDCIL